MQKSQSHLLGKPEIQTLLSLKIPTISPLIKCARPAGLYGAVEE